MTKATDSTKANGDRPVQEIEITPEMIRAVSRMVCEYEDGDELASEFAARIIYFVLQEIRSHRLPT